MPATIEHAKLLDLRLPGFDAYLNGRSFQEYMESTLDTSHEAWTWLTPEVGCMFGLSYGDFLSPPIFWLYPGPQVKEKKLSFLREALRLKPYFLQKYPVISGFCNIEFAESERFIRWMGGTIKPPTLVNGLKLSEFHVEIMS